MSISFDGGNSIKVKIYKSLKKILKIHITSGIFLKLLTLLNRAQTKRERVMLGTVSELRIVNLVFIHFILFSFYLSVLIFFIET